MSHRRTVLVLALTLVGASSTLPCALAQENRATATVQGRLFPDMGPHHRPITTTSDEAQALFDQGLTWYYSFNHDEAIRSFRRAAELDPNCAMAWWGIAHAAGPQHNHPKMTPERNAAAWEAIVKARELIEHTSPVERALIEALSQRFTQPPPEDYAELNLAYAEAMANVYDAYPNDSDVATLYAEAMMVLNPWRHYSLDYKPAPKTPLVERVLERVLEMDPTNPGANHLYIHSVEMSADPYRGLDSARRLRDLVPMSGHLMHMTTHIYLKTSHWEDAVEMNERAVRADESYRTLTTIPKQQYTYEIHNAHVGAYAAMMAGREGDAMRLARKMWEIYPGAGLPPHVLNGLDRWMCSIYDVQKRFGRWDDLLAEPAPPSELAITQATWRAARAVAYAAKKDFESAQREHQAFREAKSALPPDTRWGRDTAHIVLEVADHFIAGELSLQQGDWEEAIGHLLCAAEIEDGLGFGEPPQWLQPVRHTLGAVYMKAGQFADAERAYREDLKKWPKNGWSLFGLSRALEAQGQDDEAARVRAEYERVWHQAEEKTTTSCKCIPAT